MAACPARARRHSRAGANAGSCPRGGKRPRRRSTPVRAAAPGDHRPGAAGGPCPGHGRGRSIPAGRLRLGHPERPADTRTDLGDARDRRDSAQGRVGGLGSGSASRSPPGSDEARTRDVHRRLGRGRLGQKAARRAHPDRAPGRGDPAARARRTPPLMGTQDTRPAFDLYVWDAPREIDADGAGALVATWLASGGDPATSPFEATTNVGWFFRELVTDHPNLDAVTDAIPRQTRVPVWASGSDEAPARVVALRLRPENAAAVLEDVYGLATKYDLIVFEPRGSRIHRPNQEMAELAHATFWPRGARRAGLAGGGGALLAVIAWLLGIPIV